MRTLVTLSLLALLLPTTALAQRGGARGQRMQTQGRQVELQRQVLRRFVEQSGRELQLSTEERTRIEQILVENNTQRRELAQQAATLRRRLAEAVRDSTTTDEQFTAILNEFTALREREHALWRTEQEQIAATLPPRKRALFTMRWLRLQENIRSMLERRRESPDSGGGPSRDRRPH